MLRLAQEEYQKLLSVSLLHLRHILLYAYKTGMRGGKIVGLTWPKVDLKTDLIRLPGEDTKTGEKRITPISSALRETREGVDSAPRARRAPSVSNRDQTGFPRKRSVG